MKRSFTNKPWAAETPVKQVGGTFVRAGGVGAKHVACWDGASWKPLGNGRDGDVWALAASGTNLYVGGSGVALWNGVSWFPLGGLGGTIYALAADGTNVYAGGIFRGVSGSPNIARWDGVKWNPLGRGSSADVQAIAVIGNDVYAAGIFALGDVRFIGRWDGSVWWPLGAGVNNRVYSPAAVEGNLYVGGAFTQAGTAVGANIARWDGTNWHGFGNANEGIVSDGDRGTNVPRTGLCIGADFYIEPAKLETHRHTHTR